MGRHYTNNSDSFLKKKKKNEVNPTHLGLPERRGRNTQKVSNPKDLKHKTDGCRKKTEAANRIPRLGTSQNERPQPGPSRQKSTVSMKKRGLLPPELPLDLGFTPERSKFKHFPCVIS